LTSKVLALISSILVYLLIIVLKFLIIIILLLVLVLIYIGLKNLILIKRILLDEFLIEILLGIKWLTLGSGLVHKAIIVVLVLPFLLMRKNSGLHALDWLQGKRSLLKFFLLAKAHLVKLLTQLIHAIESFRIRVFDIFR